jgi:hypothetical protein
MANVKISQLPVTTTLTGNSVFPVVSGATTYQVSANTITEFATNSLGNIATINLNGNVSTVLAGDGTWVAQSGGNASTGNVTFDNNIVIGTGDGFGSDGLYLAVGPSTVANAQLLRVRGGDNPTHIHLDTGDNDFYDQYFGDDSKYLKLEAGISGNIVIGTDGNGQNWTFDDGGDLTVPGDIQTIISGPAFSSNVTDVDTTSPPGQVYVVLADNVFTGQSQGQVTISGVVGTTEANDTWYYQAVEANAFQLFSDPGFTVPVDGTGWTAYVPGSGTAVAQDYYNNLSITGGAVSIVNNAGNTWTFGSTGNLTFPSGLTIYPDPTGPEDSIIEQSANATLRVVATDVFGLLSLNWEETPGAPGNITQILFNDTTGNLGIYTGNTAATYYRWGFEKDGNLTLPGNTFAVNYANGDPVVIGGGGGTGDITFVNTTISAPTDETIFVQALSDNGEVNSSLRLDPNDTLTRLEQWSGQDSESFTDADWTTGTYGIQGGQGEVVFTGADTLINAIDALGNPGQIFFSVNGGPQLVWDGSSAGGGTIRFYTPTLPDPNPTVVTSFEYYYSYKSGFEIDYDSNEVTLYTNEADVYVQTTGGSIGLNSSGEMNMSGNGSVGITNFSGADPVFITTNNDAAPYQWTFGFDGSVTLPTVNSESAKLVGTRTVVGGQSATNPYSTALAAGGTPTVAYISTSGVLSARLTFAVQSSGASFQWEQFDVVAVVSQDTPGEVNLVVSNRVKSATGVDDTVVTAAMNGSNQIEISLTLDAAQTGGGASSFNAVEFGLMID